MKKSESLFVLIKSLTQSEKRHFKLAAGSEKQVGNFIRLFDAIAAQDVYDEAAIKRKFKGEKFIRQLHVTKNYLHKNILRSLRNFHGRLSKDAEVKDILRNIEILFNKELYDHCKYELRRAEKIAEAHELSTALFEIYDWKRRLRQNEIPHDYPGFRAALNAQQERIDQLQNNNDYLKLIVDVSAAVVGGDRKRVQNEKLLNDPSNALTLDAMVLHYNANYFRKIQSGDADGGAKILYELLDKLEQHPQRLEENPSMYVSTMNNFISYFVFNKQPDEAAALIERARTVYQNFKVRSENRTLLKQILRTYNMELEVYRDTRRFEQHPEMIEHVEAFVSKHTYKMPAEYLISFWFQLANIRFMQEDFKKALYWVNQIMQSKIKTRRDLLVQARMLNLMIHVEQQNLFVLRYFVDSARRYLRKGRTIEPYENILLGFFSRIGKAPLLEYNKEFKNLQTQLFPESGETVVPENILDYIDYRLWLSKKVN